MNKFQIIVIALFGFLLLPAISFACENNSGKKSSTKEIAQKMDNDDCCKKDNHSKTNNHEGCGSKCHHSKCICVASCNFSVFSINELKYINFSNLSSEKQKFYNYKTTISSGFYSLWYLPKIS